MKKRYLEPRVPTPAPEADESRSTSRLPDELLSEQVQRFALFVAVGAGLWTFALVMDTVIIPRTIGIPVPRLAIAIEIAAIVVSALAFLYVRYSKHTIHTKRDAGLVYMLLNAFGIALLNTFVAEPVMYTPGQLSWNAILILLTAMILPTSPRKMLITSLAAASMDPLGVWLAHLSGLPGPSALNTFVLFMPNYVCAVVAVVPAHVFQHLGHRLREAQELGSYQLVELLGRGGMGEVWRAQHRLLASSAAIKLVRPELLGAANQTEARTMVLRFEREARATAALSSPHTIRIYDFGATREGTFYYVMELLTGRDLESLIREFGPMPADRAVYLLRQVCQSLADAHARGLVHRDIKPANIYVCRMGLEYDFVKVLDFGLVKFDSRANRTDDTMTAEHTTTGTPAYMAPEVILGEHDVDRQADVYALGCVAYYLLTGQLVFEADTPMKMLLQHVQAAPIPPSQRTELEIPRDLEAVVMACLEKDPRKRPQDARHLLSMAKDCHSCETWDNDAAQSWWQKHLLEMTGPLALPEATPVPDRRVVIH